MGEHADRINDESVVEETIDSMNEIADEEIVDMDTEKEIEDIEDIEEKKA